MPEAGDASDPRRGDPGRPQGADPVGGAAGESEGGGRGSSRHRCEEHHPGPGGIAEDGDPVAAVGEKEPAAGCLDGRGIPGVPLHTPENAENHQADRESGDPPVRPHSPGRLQGVAPLPRHRPRPLPQNGTGGRGPALRPEHGAVVAAHQHRTGDQDQRKDAVEPRGQGEKEQLVPRDSGVQLLHDPFEQPDLVPDPGADQRQAGHRGRGGIDDVGQLLPRHPESVADRAHGRAHHQGVGVVVEEDRHPHQEGGQPRRAGPLRPPRQQVGDSLGTPRQDHHPHHADQGRR